jgi:hypothetical protein
MVIEPNQAAQTDHRAVTQSKRFPACGHFSPRQLKPPPLIESGMFPLRLWHSADITTLNPEMPRARAVVTAGPVTLAVGGDDLADHWRSRADETINLEGRSLIPGITDSHIHLIQHGLSMRDIALERCSSTVEVIDTVRRARLPESGWISGIGFQVNRFRDGEQPHRRLLDDVFPDRPVALHSRCLHQVWVNSAALRAAGITRDTVAPPGGVICRDGDGEPTGILQEEANALISRAQPPTQESDRRDAIRAATDELWSHGVVAVHAPESQKDWVALTGMRQSGTLHMRTFYMPPFDMAEKLVASGLVLGFGDRWLRLGPLKVFTDGALGSATALMHSDYEGQLGNRGVEVTSPDRLREMADYALAHRWRLAVHAIGDRAVDFTADTLSAAQAAHGTALDVTGIWDRIEHVQCLSADTAARMARARIAAAMQPIHLFDDWGPADRLWGARAARAYACRALQSAGVPVTLGSDAPVASTNPFHSIHATVTRTDLEGQPSGGWHSEQSLDVESALIAHCLAPARIAGEESWRGSIAPGKVADFVALSDDPWRPDLDWRQVSAQMTVVDGTVVFDRNSSHAHSDQPEFAEVPLS